MQSDCQYRGGAFGQGQSQAGRLGQGLSAGLSVHGGVGPGGHNPGDDLAEYVAEMEAAGVRVLFDDREGVSPGVRFKDAELIGVAQETLLP